MIKTFGAGVPDSIQMDYSWEHQYLNLVRRILEHGDDRQDRTGTGTRAIFGQTIDIDLRKGFPAVTTKKLAMKGVISELIWFMEGSGDERRLAEILHGTRDESKKTIWTQNASADYWKPKAKFDGDLGRVYGVQWRHWRKYNPDQYEEPQDIDQLKELVTKLKTNNTDRRMILSAWNVGEIDQMALPPCHMMAQFFVAKGKLSCQMYQRSVDTMLGLPFNIASYALLTHMLAQVCGYGVDRLVMNLGDVHIYKNHLEKAAEQVERSPDTPPSLIINPSVNDIEKFRMSDFALQDYSPQPGIEYEMST
jgi:thymidylate synthase